MIQFSSNVLIIGGGINGYLLAYILSKANLSVIVIDKKQITPKKNLFDGRAYAMSYSSVNVFKAINIWDEIQQNAQEIKKMLISTSKDKSSTSLGILEFNKSDLHGEIIGFMVEDRFLLSSLYDRLQDTNVQIIRGKKAESFQVCENEALIKLSGGDTIKADLVVAADGKRSEIAKKAGISRFGWHYGQKALVSAVSHEHSHDATAYQIFYPSGPFAILPLKGNKSSLVWTETSTQADEIMKLTNEGYLARLKNKFGNFLGEIELIGDKYVFDLDLGVSEQIVGDRLALVGDSAQNIHPIAGQGLNLGIRDVACLAEVLIQGFRLGEDIGSLHLLRRYEQWRRLDTTLLFAATDSVNRFFSNNNSLLNFGSSIGMKVIDNIPYIKRLLMYEAMGVNGDLPKLLRGFVP